MNFDVRQAEEKNFLSHAPITRLVGAMMLEQNDEWC